MTINIQQKIENRNEIVNSMNSYFKRFQFSQLMRESNFTKEKGFATLLIFKFIFILVFNGKNFYQTSRSSYKPLFGKDVVYRFLNSTRYNWHKFLLLLNSHIIQTVLSPLTSKDRVNVLIADDSYYDRNRSKNVELLSRIRDHSDGRYKKGFRMLTLGWSDGNSFLPLAFNLLSSSKKRNQLCSINNQIDKRTNGFKRRVDSLTKSTDALLSLVKSIKKYNIPAKHILFDSWFSFPSTIGKLLNEGFYTIAMLKSMPKVYYLHNGNYYNLQRLYSSIKKKRGRAKLLASVVVELKVNDTNGKAVKAKIVFVRDRNRSRKWLAIISSDINLEDEEIVRIYGKRWDIEVFFKISKSFLNLAKEFQSRSYDALVAHTSIVFTRYILLAVRNREEKDDKTLGNLFFQYCDELEDTKLFEALNLMLEYFKIEIKNIAKNYKNIIEKIINKINLKMGEFTSIYSLVSKCES